LAIEKIKRKVGKDLKNRKLLSVLLLTIFAVGIISMAVPVNAAVDGRPTIVAPNYVVPGGSIWVYIEDYSATGGSTYFWLSEDNDAEISSGDIQIAKEDTDDVEAWMDDEGHWMTIKIPTDVEPEEYYLKVSEDNDEGDDALPSRVIEDIFEGMDGIDTVEVLEEADWPTITVDKASGTVYLPYPDEEYRLVDVDGEDIDEEDYDYVELFWDEYSTWKDAFKGPYEEPGYNYQYAGYMHDENDTGGPGVHEWDVDENGEFSAEDIPLTEAYMGEHDILVLLYNVADEETLGAYGTFTVEPSLDVVPDEDFSIEADELEEMVDIRAHGFPEGKVDEDEPPEFQVNDIEDGDLLETLTGEIAADADIEDDEDEPPGTFDDADVGEDRLLTVTDIDEAPEGIIDIVIDVDGETLTFENALLSSLDSDPGDAMGMMDKTSGKIGDKVWFYAIDLPADTDVDVIFRDSVRRSIEDDMGIDPADLISDGNGAWKIRVKLDALPGGEYEIDLEDLENDRGYDLGTFEILPKVTFYSLTDKKITSTTVGDGDDETFAGTIRISGTGFMVDATFMSIEFSGKALKQKDYHDFEDDFEVIIDESGDFASGWIEVPKVSGGGEKVTVEIIGEDDDGDRIIVESEIKIKPRIQDINVVWDEDADEYDKLEGVLVLEPTDWSDPDEYWVDFLDVDSIFGGQSMMITGVGFKAGESVTVTFTSEDKEIDEDLVVVQGAEATSSGGLEVIFLLPTSRDFAKTIVDGDLEVTGSTDTNKDSVVDRYEDYVEGDAYVMISSPDDDEAKLFFNIDYDPDLDLSVKVGDEAVIVGCGFDTNDLVLEIDDDEVAEVESDYGYFETTVTIPELERGLYTVDETEVMVSTEEWKVSEKVVLSPKEAVTGAEVTASGTGWHDDEEVDMEWPDLEQLIKNVEPKDGSWEETFTMPDVEPGPYTLLFIDDADEDAEVIFRVLGPLQIGSLSIPSMVRPGSSITISISVQNYFGTAIENATVTGAITPPVGVALTLTFTEATKGIYTASWLVPADADEGSYTVDVTAEKAEVGGIATSSGSFFVEAAVKPVDISELEAIVANLATDVSGLSGDLSGLATDVSGLKSDIAALKADIGALPVVPLELIYVTAIMAVIAAIAAIAAVVAVYRKIA